jgi:phenylalanyl-tRNA synthetase alpha subunit
MVNQIKRDDMYDKLGNIDQIRDIIFGAQLREYNSRFEKIESDIVATQDELRDRISEVKNALTSEMRVAIESLEKKIKTLQTSSEEERQDLRQQVDRTYRKTTANFDKLSTDLEDSTNSLRDELNETREKLQEDVRSLRTYIQEELDRRLTALGDMKVSRDDMAEILFELGMRLKGTEFVPELEEASDLILVDRMSTE